jgi:hypothetical protein
MADATSTFTVRGKADVDDAVQGLNKLGDEAKKAGDKADGMGGQFRTLVGSILTAETAMKGLELVLEAARAAFDFARDATLEYMQSTTEGRAQIALFSAELGNLKTAIGESVTQTEAFGDGFDASLEAIQDTTDAVPELIVALDKYYQVVSDGWEATAGFRETTFPLRQPPSAVINTLASASLMRSASDCDEKPPNTTLWAAPMRAQASIATAASGTIGR